MQIRHLQETDLPDLIKFVASCEGLTAERPSIFWLFWKFFRSTCFIAFEEQKMVGVLLGFLDQVEGKVGFIHELGVTEKHREQGVATALLNHFEEAIQHKGGTAITLTTYPSNERAIHFYRARGFKEERPILKVGEPRIEFSKRLN